jgi:hypothetical protein
MTLVATRSPTIGGLLFPGGGSAEEIQQLLDDRGVVENAAASMGRIRSSLARAAAGEVGSVVAGLLDLDLVDVLVSGWQKYDALSLAAEETLLSPGQEHVIDLATHRITSTHAPSVELVVDGVPAPIASIDFEIDLAAVIQALRAVVSGGKLTAIRSGDVELSAKLSCEGVELTSIEHRIDPSLELDLGSGVPLREPLATVWLPEPPS